MRPTRMPLSFNRKQLVTEYEISFTDPVFGKRHYLSVPPELSTVLPTDDFKHRYDTCAVVGNSGSLVNSNLGNAIDDHDAVFRFHNAPTHHFEADVGSKTQFQVLDHYWLETLLSHENGPQEARWWVEDATLVLWSLYSQEGYIQLRQLFPTSPIVYLSRNLVTIMASAAERMKMRIEDTMQTHFNSNLRKELSSFFFAVMFSIQVCGQVDVYGMDSRSGKFHYYDDYDPGDDERDRSSLEFLMFLVLQATGHVHSIPSAPAPAAQASALALQPVQCTPRQCVNDCSNRGIYVNGTCNCEPIYAGSDCSINIMEKELARLLGGLNTTYHGPILMNKGEVNGTIIKLPDGVTHSKTRDGDVYKVDRMLYNVLPDEDTRERYGTCAIVGNSGALLNKEAGRDIDAHDLIYRFNQAPVKGYEVHVGSRSSFESLNGYWVKELMDEKRGYRWNWRSRDTGVILFELFEPWAFIWKTKTQILDKDRWWKQTYAKLKKLHPDRKIIALSPQFVSWSYLLYRELRRRFQRMRLGHYPGEKPMSGFYSFFFCLHLCEQVDIYGFAPYNEDSSKNAGTKYHYFDSAVPRPGSHSFDLARYIYQLFELKQDNVRIYD
ncbi:glycosyltransferase 29 protein [Cymbomonas tetramitiformis]|uniref:Glycosyltransferase 29 protein n=1 Tax=Cymbomonas tetramitiformis TaxID=36881 RepID=A0AAE0FYG4_9CHLO|nr:glycosyltransferase 29 protein [Cymbomonas tetramitiformis]